MVLSSRPLAGDNGSTHFLSDVYYIKVHLSFRGSWPRVMPRAIKLDCGPNLTGTGQHSEAGGEVDRKNHCIRERRVYLPVSSHRARCGKHTRLSRKAKGTAPDPYSCNIHSVLNLVPVGLLHRLIERFVSVRSLLWM